MSTILYITSNAIHVYAIYIFIDTFLGKSCLSNFFSRLTYILYFLIGTTCWIFTENQTLNLVLNTLPILLITFQYCTSWTRMLFSAISSCAVGMFIDWIAVSAFGYNTIVQTGFIQCVAFLICASLFRYYYKYKDMQPFKSKYLWLLIIISIGTALIGVVTVNENSPYDYLIATVLLLINFLNFYVYNIEQKSWRTHHRLKLIEVSNCAYQNQLRIVNESQQQMRFLKHDFHRHINKLKLLSESNDMHGIVEYLSEMEDALTIKQEYIKTGKMKM